MGRMWVAVGLVGVLCGACGGGGGVVVDAAVPDAARPDAAIFAPDATVPDATVPDAAGVDASAVCTAFEPNDTRATAAPIGAAVYTGLAICPGGDRDNYSFALGGAQDLVLQIVFDNMMGAGDLDMTLYNSGGTVVAQSNGFGDVERIEQTLAVGGRLPADSYVVEVFGFSFAVEADYELELSITP